MALSDPFNDVSAVGIGAIPGGSCDGLLVTTAGNLQFTALKGGDSGVFAVTAGQLIPFRVKAIGAGTTAAVLAGYHKTLP